MGSPARRSGPSPTPRGRARILPRELKGAAGGPGARAPVTAEIKQLRAARVSTRGVCDLRTPRTPQKRWDRGATPGWEVPASGRCARDRPTAATSPCSSVFTLSDLQRCTSGRLDPESVFAETGASSPPPSAYLILLHQCLPPEKLTKREKRLKGKVVVALRKRNDQIQEAQMRQHWLLEENRQLQKEKVLVEAESKSILDYLTENSKHRERKCEELWKEYFQQYQELERRKQELVSRYEKETSELKSQLLRGEKVQYKLEQWLQALRNIATIQERQDRRIQTLQEQIERVPAELHVKDREAHFQFLQHKALLEQEIKELDLVWKQLGERKRGKLPGKAQALEYTAQKSHFEFCRGLYRENQQVRKKLKPLLQEAQKLEAIQSQLENQKQQLKQRQWYQESIMRGRRQLQSRRDWSPKEQGALKTTLHPPLDSKPTSKGIPKVTDEIRTGP
ncbi:coiled-coil domain-containing protein 121 [Heterocephalus glaber]|uniref:Coiled-coil domain-containing protein 121 n=1 Tax=Heterocephalus glaber TaxID=10181 RepID=A0AAX6NXG8_HETGA|nr:coiled-coil domain-containing protein 121 [Heterocephalus glaber]